MPRRNGHTHSIPSMGMDPFAQANDKCCIVSVWVMPSDLSPRARDSVARTKARGCGILLVEAMFPSQAHPERQDRPRMPMHSFRDCS